jgi:hypothetical protein
MGKVFDAFRTFLCRCGGESKLRESRCLSVFWESVAFVWGKQLYGVYGPDSLTWLFVKSMEKASEVIFISRNE